MQRNPRNAVDTYTGAAKMNDGDSCHVSVMSHLQVHVAITKDLTHEKQLASCGVKLCEQNALAIMIILSHSL